MKNIKSIKDIKNVNVHGKRISDRSIFWLFVLPFIFVSHYYIHVTIGSSLARFWEALWLFLGTAAMLSSVAAGRLSEPRRARRRISLKSAIHRFGALWNIFVVLTAAFTVLVRPFTASVEAMFAVSSTVSLLICAYGAYEARTVRSTKFTLPTDKISSGRVRIVQISDLHISPYMILKHVKRVVDAAVEAEPDMIVITGDLIDGAVGDGRGVAPFFRPYAAELKRLAGTAKKGGKGPSLGVWAIPGNHDYYDGFGNSSDFMKLASVKLLSGEKKTSGPVAIVGADDLDHLKKSERNPDITKSEELVASLSEEEKRKFVLLLRHRPVVEPSTVGNFDLQLSGHTHGGQLFSMPSSMHKIPGKPKGLLSLGGCSNLYVSNGAGFVGPPMRFLAPAEVVIVDLVPSAEKNQAQSQQH